jgi:Zinc carboxypeptidase
MRENSLLFVLLLVMSLVIAAPAQTPDTDYATQVKEWTTRPEFMSPLVDHLPKSSTVPSPKDVLGYYIGAPKKLTYYADVLKYYRTLAAKSPRVKVINIGKTEEGRDLVMVFVGSEDSIKNLDTYKKNLARLADPRGLSDEEARKIIAATKPIYTLSGGLHSAELGPPEMLMELAYRLATEESPLIQKIRSEVVVAIMPVADPDGRDRSIDWYNRYLIDVTDDNATFEGGVPYWGKYTKHDDNRDINYAGLANQSLLKWYLEWHPPIMHDLHESVWFLYTYSGQAPQNTLFDPILWGELPWFSNFEMSQLTKYGMPGVWTHGYVDGWSPGYVAIMSANHNGMMRMYEIMGNGGATTMHRFIPETKPELTGGAGPMGDVSKRQWFRPSPPYRDVVWSMRNNTNYAETGVLTALQLTSAFPQVILENFYTKSKNSIHSGETEPPYAFILPGDQEDMTRVAFVIKILRMQGIEVGRATHEIKLKDGTYPAGSLVVKCNQPYGRLAKTLLGKQVDPNPELTTYDDSAWTMSLMTRTTIQPTTDTAVLQTSVDPVTEYAPAGKVSTQAEAVAYAVPDHGSPNMITLRYQLKDIKIEVAEDAFKAGSVSIPAGSFIVPASALQQLQTSSAQLGLDAVALTAKPSVTTHEAELPRVAIYSTWGGTQDVGWVRYAFDQYKIPYDLIFKERVLKGDLNSDYDLILIPNQARTSKALVTDIPKGKIPLAYTKTEKYKFLGDYGSSEDITGGMGAQGAAEFQRFTEHGGLLVTLGNSSSFPPDFGITPKVDSSTTTSKFYAPGPIVEAQITQPKNPIFYGYSSTTVPVRWANGPLFRMAPELNKRDVLMRYPGGDKAVLSGLMNGADEIKGRAAVVETTVGRGKVVMFTTNPVWRWQNLGEFRMLFNTILNYKDLEESQTGSAQ